MSNIALIVNTHSSYKDVWPLFFKQVERYAPSDLFEKKYIFVDELSDSIPSEYICLPYDKDTVYREQFISCIDKVPEKYCIYISEDYILYSSVREDLIKKYKAVLEKTPRLSFIRFMKGGVIDINYPSFDSYSDLFQLHHSMPYFYTNQVALWRTRELERIHVQGPNLHIANEDWQNSFEFQATQTCRKLDIQGAFCYHGEKKRGLYHHDCVVFPHISTALVKGKWNVSEYPDELIPLLQECNIDVNIRGFV